MSEVHIQVRLSLEILDVFSDCRLTFWVRVVAFYIVFLMEDRTLRMFEGVFDDNFV